MDWLVLFTRGLGLVVYAAVFVYAFVTLCKMSGNWTRKATLVVFMGISGYWAAIFVHLIIIGWNDPVTGLTPIAMWMRVGHIFTAVGLWTVISFLRLVAKQYSLITTGKGIE